MRRPAALLAISLLLAACSSSGTSPDGKSANPGKPIAFQAAAGRSGTQAIRLEGVEFGSGPFTVVFVHEQTASQDAWTQIAREAAEKGFRALTINLRGFGVSEGRRTDLALSDLDVEGAVKYARASGAVKVFLVGGGVGGTASLAAATRAPVEGIVAVSAPVKFRELDGTATVPKLEIPVLYIAAADDTSAANDARALTALRGDQVRELVTGAGHASQLLSGEKGQQIRKRILEFIEEVSVSQGE